MNKNNLRSKQEKNQLYPDFHLLFRSQQHCEIIILKKIIKNKKTTTTSQANIINHATELMKLKMKQQKKRNTNSLARLARRRRERKRKTEMAPVSRRLVAVWIGVGSSEKAKMDGAEDGSSTGPSFSSSCSGEVSAALVIGSSATRARHCSIALARWFRSGTEWWCMVVKYLQKELKGGELGRQQRVKWGGDWNWIKGKKELEERKWCVCNILDSWREGFCCWGWWGFMVFVVLLFFCSFILSDSEKIQ